MKFFHSFKLKWLFEKNINSRIRASNEKFFLGKIKTFQTGSKKPGADFYAFLIIFILGFAVRIYHIYSVPAGFFCDEASIGVNAYSILTTGKDEFGAAYPIFYKAFGEYKNPIQMYSTIPFVALFGLDEMSVRLPSIMYGLLALIAIYFLVREIFKKHDKRNILAILAMYLLAVSPWAIHFSRVSLEGLMAFVFYMTLGLFLFQKSQSSPKFLPFSLASFALALYCYFPARIFVPLYGIGLFFIYIRFFLTHKKVFFISLIVLAILLVPFIQNILSPNGLARWKQVNIFTNSQKDETVQSHIIHNYLLHFSPKFLFQEGDIGMSGQSVSRHSVRGLGELYLFQFPLIFLGLFWLFKINRKAFFAILLWLILYPTGSMFTTDTNPQATRSIIGVIPFQVLSAAGIYYLLLIFNKLHKFVNYLYTISVVFIILLSFFYYISLYFIKYPDYSSDYWGWQYGPREIVGYFMENKTKYDDFIMSSDFNAPEIFLKFYAPNNCTSCRIGLPDNSYQPSRRQIFAVTQDYINSHSNFTFKPVKTIHYPNGSIAFVLTEINNSR